MALTADQLAQMEAQKARLYGKWRIYKPMFLDENNLKRDLDREFESISQALIAVTERLDAAEKEIAALKAKP